MVTVRRWYVFLVCLVSLQSVTAAIIGFLAVVLLKSNSVSSVLFPVAVVVIGLPVFLGHWLSAQRSAARDNNERGSTQRHLYLFGTLAIFLSAILINCYDLLSVVLFRLTGGEALSVLYHYGFTVIQVVSQDVIALVVLAILWFYHWTVLSKDIQSIPETGPLALVQRWYVLGFSATGLFLLTNGANDVMRWIMLQFGTRDVNTSYTLSLDSGLTNVVLGLALWLFFWRWAQRLFNGKSEEEHASTLRSFYLYASVFIAAFFVVADVAVILVGIFRGFLKLPPQGDLRTVLPAVIVGAAVWAYQALVLRHDAAVIKETPRQSSIRRLFWYLAAAIGLGSFLVGLAGDISVLVHAGDQSSQVGNILGEQFAYNSAVLIVGLLVWWLTWRKVQEDAFEKAPTSAEERHSLVRKIYLYFFLFAATMTVLSTLISIVYQVLTLLFGVHDRNNAPLPIIAQAVAFALIGAALWVYHNATLRLDARLNRDEQSKHLANLRIAVVDAGDGEFGLSIMNGLRRTLPELTLTAIGLTPAAAQVMGKPDSPMLSQDVVESSLHDAGLIVGFWNIMMPNGSVTAQTANAVATSAARKLLVPMSIDGWDWVGADGLNTDTITQQTVQAVEQIAAGDAVKLVHPLGAGAIVGIVFGILILLVALAMIGPYFFRGF